MACRREPPTAYARLLEQRQVDSVAHCAIPEIARVQLVATARGANSPADAGPDASAVLKRSPRRRAFTREACCGKMRDSDDPVAGCPDQRCGVGSHARG